MLNTSRIEAARHAATFSRAAAVIVMCVGLLVLLGWQLDVASLKSVVPGYATMKANTAASVILSGIALWLFNPPSLAADLRTRAAFTCASLVLAIGVLTLAEFAFGIRLGIDQALFGDAANSEGLIHPGRMSIASAVSFSMVGGALLTLNARPRRGLQWSEYLALCAAFLSYLALMGYLFGVAALQKFGPYTSMALNTAAATFILSAGILCARPDRGLFGTLMSKSAGAIMGRRLLPAAFVLPPLLGWVRTLGQQAGWYDNEFGRALLVASFAVVFATLIWRNVSRLNRLDAERAQVLDDLQRGQILLRSIVDNSPAVIYVKEASGRYLMVNPRFTELFGSAEHGMIGKTDHDLFTNEEADRYRAMDQRVANAGHPLVEEEVVALPDGSHTFLSVKAPLRDAAGETYAIFGISTDITERQRAEKERALLLVRERAAREDAEALNRIARSLASELDLEEIVQLATDASRRLTGAAFGAFFYTDAGKDGANQDAFEKLGLPRNLSVFETAFRSAATLRIADVHEDPRFKNSAASRDWLDAGPSVRSFLAVPVLARSGGVLGGLCFGHPERGVFTERAERMVAGIAAQAAIAIDNARLYASAREQQLNLENQIGRLGLLGHITQAIGQRQDLPSILQIVIRTLEERLPIDFGCVALYDAERAVLKVTQVGVRSAPLARQLMLTENSLIPVDQNGLARCVRGELVHEADLGTATSPFPRRLASGGLRAFVAAPLHIENKVFGVVIAARREPGSFSGVDCEFLRQLSEHVGLAAHQAELYGALQRAYDDLRHSQQSVLQQERLRALGQMASGIAHDINNAISPASIYIESLLEHEPGLSDRSRGLLTTVQRAIDDVAQTVSRLREFHRPREAQLALTPVDLNLLVHQVVDLTRARWSDMPHEQGYVIEVHEELADDLPHMLGAEPEIRDGLTNLIFNAVDSMPHGGTITLRTRSAGNLLSVEICDTGVGMDEDTRSRCLEPFFTTKGAQGTGLGLAMVYGMLQRHSGELEIDTVLGKGTCMRLLFPVAAPDDADTAIVVIPAKLSRSLRILVTDDDPMLLESLRDFLESDGHRVMTAEGGQQGIDAFAQAGRGTEPFDIVITDLGMPYIDGRKVAIAIHDLGPGTPVILLTGWGQRLLDEGDLPLHVSRVLVKPPKADVIRAALAELAR